MKKLSQVLGALAVLVGVSGFGFAANTCAPSDNWCYVSGPSQSPTTQGRLDSSGNETLNGSLSSAGATFTGAATLWSRTLAQIQALTPSTTGQMVWCSNCSAAGALGTVCVSSGSTAAYQFILSTGTQCK